MASPQEMFNSPGGHEAEGGPGIGVCGNFPPEGREQEAFKSEGPPFSETLVFIELTSVP